MEGGRFQWPSGKEEVVAISSRELRWLLDGLSLRLAYCIALFNIERELKDDSPEERYAERKK
ncbi:transposase [Paenibacillus sp. sptzw28]|nr:transposase [Paenibacillus sp. sptzw28]